jgi:hypothetical protein
VLVRLSLFRFYEGFAAYLHGHNGFQPKPPALNIEKEPKHKAALLVAEIAGPIHKPNSQRAIRPCEGAGDCGLSVGDKEEVISEDPDDNGAGDGRAVIYMIVDGGIQIGWWQA